MKVDDEPKPVPVSSIVHIKQRIRYLWDCIEEGRPCEPEPMRDLVKIMIEFLDALMPDSVKKQLTQMTEDVAKVQEQVDEACTAKAACEHYDTAIAEGYCLHGKESCGICPWKHIKLDRRPSEKNNTDNS